ncbi:MAG: bacterial transcriptional activator domain-containing protein [Nannocystaceae bacterium]|nr:bacterial transcriptional activator domain-containing protein [Nannocystaceae bacterium]
MPTADRSDGPTPPKPDLWQAVPPRVLLLGVLALAALVYLPTLSFDLVYDDHWTLAANGFLREPDLSLLISPEAASRHIVDAFRPTLVTFDVVSYRWFALWAPAHHALSIVLHVAGGWMLERWMTAMNAPLRLRIATVGAFGVLAVHAETVAVVSYREDLLAAAFGLGALALAERATVRRGWGRAALALGALAAMAVACGAKMSAAPLVGVFVLARVISPWRDRALRPALVPTLALGLGVLLAVAQTVAVYGTWNPYEVGDPRLLLPRVGLAATMASSVQNQLQMLWQLVVPLTLSPEYVDQAGDWSHSAPWLASAALLALLLWATGCAVRWRRPVVALSILGTALLMLPTSGLAAMPNLRADRFMYLPSALACIGLAAAALHLGELCQRWWTTRRGVASALPQLAPLIAFAMLQGGLAQAAANTYRSDTRLWTIAVRRAPHSPRAHAVLGQLLVQRAAKQERPDPRLLAQARAHCAIALRLDDGTALPVLCDARLAAIEKDWPRAQRRFLQALPRAVQGRDRVLAALASVTLDVPGISGEQRIEHAIGLLQRLTGEYPYSSEAHAVAGAVYHRLGRSGLAIVHYRRARALRPERWDLVIAELELQVDLGHPSAARLTWELYEAGLVSAVGLSRRKAARRRLHDAEQLFGTPLP